MTSDAELLDRYITTRCEPAFTELVQRYLRLVYLVALRQTGGNAFLAEDITQAVFLLLAKKAHSLRGHPILAGWLHHATRLVALRALRTELQRRQREAEVVLMNEHLTD